jgi:serine/threonine protein phosphatase 1
MGARNGADSMKFWLAVGGREALGSYGRTGSMHNIPADHWDFVENACVDWYETERHFFVHANVDPELPLDQQKSSMLHWEVFNEWCVPHCSGKIMVCGHSEQRSGSPLVLDHAISIDTFCYGGGWLTCLDVLSGQIWQANQDGESRVGRIDENGPG